MRYALILLVLAGCSTGPTITHRNGAEIRVYPNRAALVSALPPTMQAVSSFAIVHGWYDRDGQIVHALDDPGVIEHEMRHHAEPGWTHPTWCVDSRC